MASGWRCRAPTVGSATRRWISPPRSESSASDSEETRSALDTAVRFLAQRPRSEYEVRRRLRRAGLDEAVIEQTVQQLRAHRLLDDAAFAEYWVEQRQTFRPRGARLLRAELAQRGVPAPVATAAAAATAPGAEEDAYRAASRRAGQLRHLERRQFEARLSAFLARRGFDWETITAVVARLAEETLLSTS